MIAREFVIAILGLTYFSPANLRAAQNSGLKIAIDAQGNAFTVGGGLLDGGSSLSKTGPNGTVIKLIGFKDRVPLAVAVDSEGNVYIAGGTGLGNEIVSGGGLAGCPAGSNGNAFVTKLDNRLEQESFTACIGSASARALTLDADGNIYLAGQALADFPATAGSAVPKANPKSNGRKQGFIAKLNRAAERLVYATFFGGNADDEILGIAVDRSGRVSICGSTYSTNLATPGVAQPQSPGSTLYRSSDGGFHWETVGAGLPWDAPAMIVPDPRGTDSVYALVYGTGLYYSSDRGANWTFQGPGPLNGVFDANGLEVAPGRPSTLYFDVKTGLYKSTDSGRTWTIIGPSSPYGGLGHPAIDVSNPSRVYALLGIDPYVSNDGGETWQPFPIAGGANAIYVDPHDSNTIYVIANLNSVLRKSTDGGRTWTDILTGFVRSVAVAPSDPNVVYADRMVSRNAGATWTALNTGLPLFNPPLVDPHNSDIVYFGLVRSTTITWEPMAPRLGGQDLRGASAMSGDTLLVARAREMNGFAARLSADGGRIEYCTYLGGRADDVAAAIAVDPAGNAWVAGYTFSEDLPVAGSAFQTRLRGGPAFRDDRTYFLADYTIGSDGFVARLDADGSHLAETYLGGSSADMLSGIAIHPDGDIVVSGVTWGLDFPVTKDPLNRFLTNGTVTKISPDLSRIVYSIMDNGGRAGWFNDVAIYADGTIWAAGLCGPFAVPYRFPGSAPGVRPTIRSLTSSATYVESVATGSLATIRGSNLSDGVFVADGSAPPTTLGGVKVTFTDQGQARPAHLFYVSPDQINLAVPDNSFGAEMTVTTAGGTLLTTSQYIQFTAPGIFTANGDGYGVAAAYVTVTHADGRQESHPVFQCGVAPGSCFPSPVTLGNADDRATLVLYGTGIRRRASVSDVTVRFFPGPKLTASYAGPADILGLDQINVDIPRSMAGSGELTILISVAGPTSNGIPSNAVTVLF